MTNEMLQTISLLGAVAVFFATIGHLNRRDDRAPTRDTASDE